jgi:hypothetical protein
MTAAEVGAMINHPKMGAMVLKTASYFPRLELEATIQPITRTVLRVQLSIFVIYLLPFFFFSFPFFFSLFLVLIRSKMGAMMLNTALYFPCLELEGALQSTQSSIKSVLFVNKKVSERIRNKNNLGSRQG